jgi:hypothetical protein
MGRGLRIKEVSMPSSDFDVVTGPTMPARRLPPAAAPGTVPRSPGAAEPAALPAAAPERRPQAPIPAPMRPA